MYFNKYFSTIRWKYFKKGESFNFEAFYNEHFT